MNEQVLQQRPSVSPALRGAWLARVGEAMRQHQRKIALLQWGIVGIYLLLLIIPVLRPLPAQDAHVYSNLRLFAQFVFWGIWWPFVMLSMMLLGRVWCGVLCPEGTLTEFASRHGLGRPIPRWIRWSGWPFLAFVCTTVYGQLVSVYEYPQAALLVLGGSTLAALAVGYFYGKGSRVWCRYLCPANGVFSLLAKIAPVHFRVNEQAWTANSARASKIHCAPLIDIRHMKSASACHACGRCSGHRDAVTFTSRSLTQEILSSTNRDVRTEEALTLIFGMLGIATAAFLWSSSRLLVQIKSSLALWLVEHNTLWPLSDDAPWWLLTHYPDANDLFTWLDGFCILLYILLGGLFIGLLVLGLVFIAARWANHPELSWQRLTLALVPLAGTSVFLGLSMLTLGHLRAEQVSTHWVAPIQVLVLALGNLLSGLIGWRMLTASSQHHRLGAMTSFAASIVWMDIIWIRQLL